VHGSWAWVGCLASRNRGQANGQRCSFELCIGSKLGDDWRLFLAKAWEARWGVTTKLLVCGVGPSIMQRSHHRHPSPHKNDPLEQPRNPSQNGSRTWCSCGKFIWRALPDPIGYKSLGVANKSRTLQSVPPQRSGSLVQTNGQSSACTHGRVLTGFALRQPRHPQAR
jgi:hypothetical protein